MFRPFELLKLIRDGYVSNFFQLRTIGDTRDTRKFGRMLMGLEKLGFIEKTKSDQFNPTDKIEILLSALDLSLTHLEELTPRSVICSPSFGPTNESTIKTEIFVVMPFDKELEPVYSDHIKKVANHINKTIVRGDDFFSSSSIISDIWDAIYNSQIIIADCTGRNPNVFYEIGIAHTLGKPVVLLAQSIEDIPFDVQHMRTILYEFTPRGMKEFEESLESTVEFELSNRNPSIKSLIIRNEKYNDKFGLK